MKLNHLNLVVSNVAEVCRLFTAYFDFTCTEIKGDHIIAVLNGADDFTLVIMSAKDGNNSYPDAFHIGFLMDDTDSVLATYERLKDDGIPVGKEPGKIRDGFGFYFNFDSIMIEVGHYIKSD